MNIENIINREGILEATRHLISGTHQEFIPGETYISPHGAIIDREDVANLVSCSLDLWYTEGKYSKEFSDKLRAYLQFLVRSVALCNSGSSANLLALSVITSKEFGERKLLPGDEVLTTAVNFPTTVNAIFQNNGVPVFVDVELGSYVPKIERIEEAIERGKTKAIVLAHTLGNPFEVKEMRDLADEYNIFLIEDCCDALGSTYRDRLVGTWGDMSTLSFYPAHHITSGEGGAVLSKSPMISKVVNSFRDWGRACHCKPGQDNACGKRFEYKWKSLPYGYDHKYVFEKIGYNLKITDLQAALLSSQMDKLPDFVEKRRENYAYLYRKLRKFKKWFILPKPTKNSDPSWFGFPLTIKSYTCSFARNDLIGFLNENKIGTRLLFAGNITKQPAYLDVEYRVSGKLWNSDIITENTFWIGLHPSLNEEHFDYIEKKFKEFLKGK